MKTILLYISIILSGSLVNAQIGPVNFIDTTLESAGVTKFETIDLNNDGFNEIITSFTGSSGRLGFYQNLANNDFSTFNLIENFSFCKGFAVGEFNGDNLPDLVAIGGTAMEARIYINTNEGFNPGIQLDSNISIQVNDVVVADFDQNDADDIVIIGQHSIDFYRNDGSGFFSKETILSTETSPNPLECLDLATKDMDGDGDIDLICGETAGLVIYINNGNGVFTPNYYSETSEIYFLIHPVDIDGDGDFDVVGRNGAGDVKWFSNNGNGVMTYEATLADIPYLTALKSIDYNTDGLEDLYVSYANHIAIFENDPNHSFSNELIVYEDENLIMGAIQTADINNQGALDYLWSGGNNTIACHINESPLSLSAERKNDNLIFPNPTNGILNFSGEIDKITLYNVSGKKLLETTGKNSLDISHYTAGIYFVMLEDERGESIQKIVKR